MFNIVEHLFNPPHISIYEALISTLSDDNDDDSLFFSQPRSKKKRFEEMPDATNPETAEADREVFFQQTPRQRDEEDGCIYWYDYYNEIGDMDEAEEIWEPSEDYAFAKRMALRKIVSSSAPITLGKSVKCHKIQDIDEAMDLFCKSEELININKQNAAKQMSKEPLVRTLADYVQQPECSLQSPADPELPPPGIDAQYNWFEHYFGNFLIQKEEAANEVIIID